MTDETSDNPPMSRKRKYQKTSSFQKFCTRHAIPHPTFLSEREFAHIDTCTQCFNLWPLYYYEYYYDHSPHINLVELCQMWSNLLEKDRGNMYTKLVKKQTTKFTILAKRHLNAFQIFKMIRSNEYKVPFSEQNKIITGLWRSLSDCEKEIYQLNCNERRTNTENTIKNLCKYEQILFRTFKQKHKKNKSCSAIKKPLNTFMCFLKSMRTLHKGLKDRDIMRMATEQWNKSMNAEDKQEYIDEARRLKAVYIHAKASENKNHKKKQRKLNKTAQINIFG